MSRSWGNLKAVKVILEMGGEQLDMEEVEEYGAYDGRKADAMGTALYKAAAGGYLEIVNALLNRGRIKDCAIGRGGPWWALQRRGGTWMQSGGWNKIERPDLKRFSLGIVLSHNRIRTFFSADSFR